MLIIKKIGLFRVETRLRHQPRYRNLNRKRFQSNNSLNCLTAQDRQILPASIIHPAPALQKQKIRSSLLRFGNFNRWITQGLLV